MSKATKVEDTAIATRTESTGELAPSTSAAAAEWEIRAAAALAQRFPRNEDAAFEKLMRSCRRPAFADDAAYSFPRGGRDITGPSVNLAREAARCWGNVRYGVDVVRDDDDTRQVRGWAWDLETNVKVSAEDDFKKLIQRKRDGITQWVSPDERDLRELTNRRGAILERNCILKIIRPDVIDDAMEMAAETRRNTVAADPEGQRKKLVLAFSDINVTVEMLEAKLEHPLSQSSPAEITRMREVYKSIRDGQSTWAEYVNGNGEKKPEREEGTLKMGDLTPSDQENRGHGQEGFAAPAGDLFSEPERTEITAAEVEELEALLAKAYGKRAGEQCDELCAKYGVAALDLLSPGDWQKAVTTLTNEVEKKAKK